MMRSPLLTTVLMASMFTVTAVLSLNSEVLRIQVPRPIPHGFHGPGQQSPHVAELGGWDSYPQCNCPRCARAAHYPGRSAIQGLPAGRTYFNGRYYGNYNNRFYGPQYGYF